MNPWMRRGHRPDQVEACGSVTSTQLCPEVLLISRGTGSRSRTRTRGCVNKHAHTKSGNGAESQCSSVDVGVSHHRGRNGCSVFPDQLAQQPMQPSSQHVVKHLHSPRKSQDSRPQRVQNTTLPSSSSLRERTVQWQQPLPRDEHRRAWQP